MKALIYRDSGSIDVVEAESIDIADRDYERRLEATIYRMGLGWGKKEWPLVDVVKVEILF